MTKEFWLILFVFTLFTTATADDKNALLNKYENLGKKGKADSAVHRDEQVDPRLNEYDPSPAELKANNAYYDMQIFNYQHTQRVYETQLMMSRIIFWLVILLVVSGMVLSWMQFLHDNKLQTAAAGSATTFKFSKDGVEISSSIIGLLILTFSLAFFYLYLVSVYPIKGPS